MNTDNVHLDDRETILLVDDEPALLRLVAKQLEFCGYRTLIAGSGLEALSVWEQHREEIDLVVTDIVMPGMTGVELADRLLADCSNLHILFTSGYSAAIVDRDFVLNSEINFLQKPYDIATLWRSVRECLAGGKVTVISKRRVEEIAPLLPGR